MANWLMRAPMDEMADAVEDEDDADGSQPGLIEIPPTVSPLADIASHRADGPDGRSEDPDPTVVDFQPVNPGRAL